MLGLLCKKIVAVHFQPRISQTFISCREYVNIPEMNFREMIFWEMCIREMNAIYLNISETCIQKLFLFIFMLGIYLTQS